MGRLKAMSGSQVSTPSEASEGARSLGAVGRGLLLYRAAASNGERGAILGAMIVLLASTVRVRLAMRSWEGGMVFIACYLHT